MASLSPATSCLDGLIGWLEVVALAMGIGLVLPLILNRRHPLPIIPSSWTGRAQLFYLVFLWSITAMNFTFVFPRFSPIRLVTEWFICLNAAFCSVFVFYASIARPALAPDTVLAASPAAGPDATSQPRPHSLRKMDSPHRPRRPPRRGHRLLPRLRPQLACWAISPPARWALTPSASAPTTPTPSPDP